MFKINKKNKGFDNLYITCKATSKKNDAARYSLNYICVKNKKVIGTDGRIMAMAANVYGIKTGFYEIIKLTKTTIILNMIKEKVNYPNYEDIIPEKPENPSGQLSDHESPSCNLSILAYKLAKHDACVELELLSPMAESYIVFDFYVNCPDQPILFTAKNIEIIVNPLLANKF